MKSHKFKIGDKVTGTHFQFRSVKFATVRSVSEDGRWIGFNWPGSHDRKEIETGLEPNYPAEDFELAAQSENN